MITLYRSASFYCEISVNTYYIIVTFIRLLITIIRVHWRDPFCTMVGCMFQPGMFAFIQMCFLSKLRLGDLVLDNRHICFNSWISLSKFVLSVRILTTV